MSIKGSYRDRHNDRINNSFSSSHERVFQTRDANPRVLATLFSQTCCEKTRKRKKKDAIVSLLHCPTTEISSLARLVTRSPITDLAISTDQNWDGETSRRLSISGNIANCFAPITVHVTRVKVYSSVQESRSDAARKCVLSLLRRSYDGECTYL